MFSHSLRDTGRFREGFEVPVELFSAWGFPENLFVPGLIYRKEKISSLESCSQYSDKKYTDPVLEEKIDYVSSEGRFVTFVGPAYLCRDEEVHEIAHDVFYGGGINLKQRRQFFQKVDALFHKYPLNGGSGEFGDFVYLKINDLPILDEKGDLDKQKNIRWATEFFALSVDHIIRRVLGDRKMPPELRKYFSGLGFKIPSNR